MARSFLTTTLGSGRLRTETDAELQEGMPVLWFPPSPLVQLPVQGQERGAEGSRSKTSAPEAAVRKPQPSCPRPPAPPLIAASSQPVAAYKQIFVLSFLFLPLGTVLVF